MTNLSRIPKFDVHTVVTGPFRGVGVVDRNEGSVLKGEDEVCWIRRREHGEQIQSGFHESKLRRASFLRWLFRRNPDGSFQVGNNPLWAFVLTMLVFAALFMGVRGEPGPWAATIRALCIGTPIAWIIFTGRQYLGITR